MFAIPVQITFRNMSPSEAVEANVREKAEKLERFSDHLMSCRVVIEAPHRHHHKGKLYHVRVDLGVVGGEIVVDREGPQDHAHEDVYVAIRDAFNATIRQLEDHERKRRGKVKTHEVPVHGRIVGMSRDHGFIATSDGREIYFHRNSLIDGDFETLETGDEVRLVIHPGEGEKGPQASTVVPVGKHHLVERLEG
ncbi:MAG: HPF/RaiA family ribosome-associated protein [Rhodospirillales bacterium]|nr:MAG: HPF/RaiA family ribosome-associated protein [Rhodospirillales bacterium]